MPANPRLVKRVANTMGMLFALKSHLGHDESEDVVARVAIMYVRFPRLVDELLSAAAPPSADDMSGAAWLRPDVQQVLGAVENVRLARCFGREYA